MIGRHIDRVMDASIVGIGMLANWLIERLAPRDEQEARRYLAMTSAADALAEREAQCDVTQAPSFRAESGRSPARCERGAMRRRPDISDGYNPQPYRRRRTTVRIGSLFSGAGGLDMAVEHVFGGTVVWHSEIDKAASKLLAYRYPDIPNLGDISAIDWSDVPAIDILCGGFPCQDVSLAASYRRQGMRPDTAPVCGRTWLQQSKKLTRK